MVTYPVVETEFAKELAKELKQARTLAQRNIQNKQKEQKYYDQRSKVKELRVGDLVMLKTALWFCLDRSFKGPFVVQSVTSTNAIIKVKDDPKAEPINVSRQRLSLCSDGMKDSSLWIGHGQKLRKQRKIHKCKVNDEQHTSGGEQENPEAEAVTRRGRQIRKPARYRTVTVPKSSLQKEEEVVRTQEILGEDRETT